MDNNDEMTELAGSQVNTTNLERMRKVKTRHQRLYARAETVREELQRFLEDDDDMAKMCLTRKKEMERMVSSGQGGATLRIYPTTRRHRKGDIKRLKRAGGVLGVPPDASSRHAAPERCFSRLLLLVLIL